MLEGKKTYILTGLMLIASALTTAGIITNDQYMTIITILFPGSIATMRMGINAKKNGDV